MNQIFTPLDLVGILKKNEKHGGNKHSRLSVGLLVSCIVLVWVFIFGIALLVTKYTPSASAPQADTPQKTKGKEAEVLIGQISALYDLPKGEVPTIATVSDKTKLEKQDFFIKAENGDKVLIYVKAKKAILFRPTTNKIIEIAPLTLSIQSPTQIPSPIVSSAAAIMNPAL